MLILVLVLACPVLVNITGATAFIETNALPLH